MKFLRQPSPYSVCQVLDKAAKGYCRSQNAVAAFRTIVASTILLKRWNLQIYFNLEIPVIAQSLAGSSAVQKTGENKLGLAISSRSTLWECLQRRWQDDVC